MTPPTALANRSGHAGATTRSDGGGGWDAAGADPVPRSGTGPRDGTVLVLVAMLLVALNLRLAITSLGALLDEIRIGMALSGLLAGIVTTLPALAFAAVGSTTPWLVRRFTPARLLVASMVALTAGQLLRAATSDAWLFVLTSAVALAGIAVANVLLPMLVRQYFPQRIGLVTGAYTMSLTIGAAVAAGAAVPIAHAAGSWRVGLGFWAVLAVAAASLWVPIAWRLRPVLTRRRPAGPRPAGSVTRAGSPDSRTGSPDSRAGSPGRLARHDGRAALRPGRTRLGWLMAAFFGAQSFSAYALMGWLAQLFRDAGFRPATAGLLLAGVTAVSVPAALVMPALASRMTSLRPLVLGTATASALGYAGLLLMPYEGALVWMVLLALGQGTFPMALAMIGLRARTGAGVVSLSAFAQSIGYLIAASGPLAIGLVYVGTGGWAAPIGLLFAALLVQTGAGWAVARPRWIEDEPGITTTAADRTPTAVTAR
ncbi:MFS transporter [Solwaraspora sp. WMMB335]|uniref:MFS transporter n=1 Tax=Solwaraspora sp. WMMB335 TaxID=3404118 RepID=UPI003B93D07D